VGEDFRVMSWNCRRATAASAVWDYFLDAEPDLALLQEVNAVPDRVRERFAGVLEPSAAKGGGTLKSDGHSRARRNRSGDPDGLATGLG
jgi:hypothetical protein